MLKFNKIYFTLTFILFLIEVLIALYAHDQIIRPYGGDFLVVILIYCFIKSFLSTKVIITALFTLIFAYTMEILQYFNIVEVLNLQKSILARTIIGTSFEWIDILAYTLGFLCIILTEHKINRQKLRYLTN